MAFAIEYQVEYPYEIESTLRELPLDADAEQASAEAKKYQEGWKPVLRQTLVADDDQELLFLVILASRCTDPKPSTCGSIRLSISLESLRIL